MIESFETGNVELYDLEADRGEQRNLAQEQPKRAAAMRQRLAPWHREVDAQMPQPR